MPFPFLIFSQSDYLIQVVDTVHIFDDKLCRSRSVGFVRSQLIWIYTVCKGRAYPGSAGQGLIDTFKSCFIGLISIEYIITMLAFEYQ